MKKGDTQNLNMFSQKLAGKTLRLTWKGRSPTYIIKLGHRSFVGPDLTREIKLEKDVPKEVKGKDLKDLLDIKLLDRPGKENELFLLALEKNGDLKIEEVKE